MDEHRQRSIAQNEALFRHVNERIRVMQDDEELDLRPLLIVCECGDPMCGDTLRIPAEAYRQVREVPERFILLRHHDIPEVEVVVETAEEYVVVEKVGDAARQEVRRLSNGD